jgi:hypothetical protein
MPSPTVHRDYWLKLLEDERTPTQESTQMWGGGVDSWSVAVSAAYAIEGLSADSRARYLTANAEKFMLLGDRVTPILIK